MSGAARVPPAVYRQQRLAPQEPKHLTASASPKQGWTGFTERSQDRKHKRPRVRGLSIAGAGFEPATSGL